MNASTVYSHQKVSSSFVVYAIVSYIFFTLLAFYASALLPLTTPAKLASLIVFVFAFSYYSYLRANVIFEDYIKKTILRSVLSTFILFINFLTCIAFTIAIIYTHFYSLLSLTQ